MRRILRELSTLVGEIGDDIQYGEELTAKIDFILARARYSSAIRGVCVLPQRSTPNTAAPVLEASCTIPGTR